MFYGFENLAGLCELRHPDSVSAYDSIFEEWRSRKAKEIAKAFEGLEAEADIDPAKRRNLAKLEEYSKMGWGKVFENLHLSVSANMCSKSGYAEELFLRAIAAKGKSRNNHAHKNEQ